MSIVRVVMYWSMPCSCSSSWARVKTRCGRAAIVAISRNSPGVQATFIAVGKQFVAVEVDGDAADAQQLRPGRLLAGRSAAAEQGAHPGGELARAERLGHVVVRTEVEAEQHVVLLGPGGQHQHREVGLAAQDPADVEAVDAGQHHVEHEQVGLQAADLLERRAAVVDDDDLVVLALEVEADELGLLRVVLGQHDLGTHGSYYRSGPRRYRHPAADRAGPDKIADKYRPAAVSV